MSAYGDWVRAARESLGLSREQLRRRILLQFETAPSVSAIRDLENGTRSDPQKRNRFKYDRALKTK